VLDERKRNGYREERLLKDSPWRENIADQERAMIKGIQV
jgi:hypothetical protein